MCALILFPARHIIGPAIQIRTREIRLPPCPALVASIERGKFRKAILWLAGNRSSLVPAQFMIRIG
jgi:hypothetical protein